MYVSSGFNDTSLSYSDVSVMNLLISQIEPLLFKYSVNFAFWGHNHAYQRMSAVYKENVVQASVAGADLENTVNTARVYNDPQATVQLLIGNAGASFSADWLDPLQDWCERACKSFLPPLVIYAVAAADEWFPTQTSSLHSSTLFMFFST